MTNSSLNFNLSRYVQGGLTEKGPIGIEWWGRFNFPLDEKTDILYTVNNNTAGRLDLIAAYYYDDPQLWWIIAQYNNILDPFVEIESGRLLRIPSSERVKTFMTQKPGGITSTRLNDNILPPIVL